MVHPILTSITPFNKLSAYSFELPLCEFFEATKRYVGTTQAPSQHILSISVPARDIRIEDENVHMYSTPVEEEKLFFPTVVLKFLWLVL